jgi:hypothetical protein
VDELSRRLDVLEGKRIARFGAIDSRGEMLMDAREIIERIQTAHWDMAACRCWICEAGRELGMQPRECYWRESGKYQAPPMENEART